MGLFDKKPLEKIIDITCTECGKEIRSDLPYCPHCKCNVVIPKEKSELNKVIKKELDDQVQENKKQINENLLRTCHHAQTPFQK